MSGRQRFVLVHDTARQLAVRAVKEAAPGMIVEIKPKTRSLDQNAKLHALFSDVSRQVTWGGRSLSPEQFKILFISAHATATKMGADLVTGLEGEMVNIRESSAHMSVSRMNSLLEYVTAWATENGVRISGSAE